MKKLLAGLSLFIASGLVYAADGATVYNTGEPLSCAYCHGKNGTGYPKTAKSRQVPAVAGLPHVTIEVFLRATKLGYVKDGIQKMHDRAVKLTDEEIVAVARHIEHLPRELNIE